MRELLRGYAAALFETARSNGELGALVGDLDGFLRAMHSSVQLRQALTDNSVRADVRRDIVVDLLTNRATQQTIELVSFAIRFERPSELSAALASLLGLAEQFQASEPETGFLDLLPPSAPIVTRDRIRGFAERTLQELRSTSDIDEVEDELFRFARILGDNPNLRHLLNDLNNSNSGRIAVVADLLNGRVQPATMRVVKFVLQAGRVRDLVGTFDRLVELAAAERGRRIGQVRSAVELTESEQSRLEQILSRLVERRVEVRVIHDPSVIGGTLISVGDLVIDGTVRVRFERLRDLLAEAS